jgi:hypothetical protein
MHGLPESFTGEAFVGRTLTSVTVYSNQVIFSFGDGASLRVESSYSVSSAEAVSASDVRAAPSFDPALMRLLDSRVAKVSPHADGTLHFTFENALVLAVFDDEPNYESYHLTWDGQELTV